MKTKTITINDIKQALDNEVKDPEIPVISVVEMGMIRDIEIVEDTVIVSMTPTFSACPALQTIKTNIKQCVKQLGFESVEIKQILNPPWTSDWISAEAREKLKTCGLAPPPKHGGDFEILLLDTVACPYCDSNNTTVKNTFGPTLCRAIYYCNACQQPFEQFKPL